MARLPKSITTVTLFSKIIATFILVLIIPLASFYAGMQYQKSASMAQIDPATAVTRTQQLKTTSEKLITFYLNSFITASTPISKRLKAFHVLDTQNISAKDDNLTFETTFTVEPYSKSSNTYWLSGNGILEPTGWIGGKRMQVEATKTKGDYVITSISPLLGY